VFFFFSSNRLLKGTIDDLANNRSKAQAATERQPE